MMLGNLNTDQIEKRLGIVFPEKVKTFMNENHQHEAANIKPGKWHCFDIPFVLVCGDMKTAETIFYPLKEQGGKVKEQLQISIQN